MTIPLVIGVNPLQTTWLERGIVSGRVALLLRSAEIHPLFERFVRWTIVHPPSSSWSASTLRGLVLAGVSSATIQLSPSHTHRWYATGAIAGGCQAAKIQSSPPHMVHTPSDVRLRGLENR